MLAHLKLLQCVLWAGVLLSYDLLSVIVALKYFLPLPFMYLGKSQGSGTLNPLYNLLQNDM